MADVLSELVAKISVDAEALKRGLSQAEGDTEKSARSMAESLRGVGIAMAASGAAVTAALGFMGKAAIDEEINIKRLATTMENAGTSYDSVKESLEAVIATTQRKTGVADNDQRDILNRLILVTGDYKKSLDLLPTVLDLAAAGQMDATTAATYLGKAYLELEQGAESVSVRFGQASLQFSSMADIQDRVAGSAENLANPFNVLKAALGDVAESIGKNLIPIMTTVINKIVDIAEKIQRWAEAHPELAKVITIVVAALGGIMTVIGGLILILPTLISGIAAFGTVLAIATGPIGLVVAAIGALIAIGVLLWKNWDKIKEAAQYVWGAIKYIIGIAIEAIIRQAFQPYIYAMSKILEGAGVVVGFFKRDWGDAMQSAARAMRGAVDTALDFAQNLRDTAFDFREQTDAVNKGTEAIGENTVAIGDNETATNTLADSYGRLNPVLDDSYENLQKISSASAEVQASWDRHAETVRIFHEAQESAAKSAADLYEQWQFENTKLGELGITYNDIINKAYDLGMSQEKVAEGIFYAGEGANAANTLMGYLGITIADLTEKVDELAPALDELKKSQDKAAESAANLYDKWIFENSELGKLGISYNDVIERAYELGYSQDEVALAIWAAGDSANAANYLMAALGMTMEDLAGSTNTAAAAQAALNAAMLAGQATIPTPETIGGENGAAQTAIWAALSNLEQEGIEITQAIQDSFQAAGEQGFDAVNALYEQIQTSHQAMMNAQAAADIAAQYTAENMLSIDQFLGMWQAMSDTSAEVIAIAQGLLESKFPTGGGLTGMAQGGVITEPTLLYGLNSMKPYAIAGESGPEFISPSSGGVNIQVAQLVVRENADIDRIAKELYRLQQQRGYAYGRL